MESSPVKCGGTFSRKLNGKGGTGDRGQGTGDRGQGTGDRGKGKGERGKGKGERGQGTGERGKGDFLIRHVLNVD